MRRGNSARRWPFLPSWPSSSGLYGGIAPVGAAPAIIVFGPIRWVPGAYISAGGVGAVAGLAVGRVAAWCHAGVVTPGYPEALYEDRLADG